MGGTGVVELVALLAAHDPTRLSDDDLIDDLVLMQRLSQVVEARKVADLREVEARKLPSARGSAHVMPWAVGTLKSSRATIGRMRKLGQSLPEVPLVAQAFALGEITGEQAQLMADAVAALPPGAEGEVLARGADLGPRELQVVLRGLAEELDPEGTQQQDEAAAARAEKRDWPKRGITLSPLDGSNLVRVQGYLEMPAAAALLAAIDALAAPQNRTALGLRKSTASGSVGAAAGGSAGACAGDSSDGSADAAASGSAGGFGGGFAGDSAGGDWSPVGEPDLRTAAQRRHDALCAIGQRIQATDTLPDHGGDRPQVVVTVGHQTLVDGLRGLGRLDDGTVLTPAASRLLACDARILPAVMGGRSLPLDLGRSRRHFNAAIRRALRIRDGGCTFPRCDRKAPWTEAHHCVEWTRGGTTQLSNSTLVCHYHHRYLHHTAWRVQINPRDGLPEYFAPGDPQPRRNHFHRRP